MTKSWVLNASPIILLGKADLLKTLSPLSKTWMVPEGVVREVAVKSPVDSYLSDLSRSSEVRRKKVSKVHSSLAAWNLGPGESEVLTLAMRKSGVGVVLDDLQARKCAILFDIPLIGSLGLIVLAKRDGLIPHAKPAFDRLIDVGLYIDPGVLNRILVAIGESGMH